MSVLLLSTLVGRGESDSRYGRAFVVTSCASARQADRSGAIMHIGFFACFHGISLERSRFSLFSFQARVVLNPLVSLMGRLEPCSARIAAGTDRRNTPSTLDAHARRGFNEV